MYQLFILTIKLTTPPPPTPPPLLLQDIRTAVLAEVTEAKEFALSGEELPSSELFTDVHTDQEQQGLYIRGSDMFAGNRDSQ